MKLPEGFELTFVPQGLRVIWISVMVWVRPMIGDVLMEGMQPAVDLEARSGSAVVWMVLLQRWCMFMFRGWAVH